VKVGSEAIDSVDDHLFRDSAHFGDEARERVKLPVVGFNGNRLELHIATGDRAHHNIQSGSI